MKFCFPDIYVIIQCDGGVQIQMFIANNNHMDMMHFGVTNMSHFTVMHNYFPSTGGTLTYNNIGKVEMTATGNEDALPFTIENNINVKRIEMTALTHVSGNCNFVNTS